MGDRRVWTVKKIHAWYLFSELDFTNKIQWRLPLHCSLLRHCFVSKASSVMLYTFTPPFEPFINFIHCSLAMHNTFASRSSSDTVGHRLSSSQTPCSGAYCYVGIYSFIVSRWKFARSYLIHSWLHSYFSQNLSAVLYSCTSLSYFSASVTGTTRYFASVQPPCARPTCRLSTYIHYITNPLFTHMLHISKPLQNISINYIEIF